MKNSEKSKIHIDPGASRIIGLLKERGFEAYAVGGCVRNALMGLKPHDWDVCTNARPEELRQVFGGFKTHDFGLKHGTLAVTAGENTYEVTTYRIDGVYADNRHPESVTFTDDLQRDLSRRDFTVNAMAYNDGEGLRDPFGGAEDLKKNLLRCVGDPDNRFYEDALRILRGLRFASVYGFEIERKTAEAIRRCAPLLKNIAPERVRDELLGILCGSRAAEILDSFCGVFAVFLPEIECTFGFPQKNPHHCHDVWHHILASVSAVPPQPLLRMTMLLHDVGKPQVCTVDAWGINHFKGHQQISFAMADDALRRLRVPKAFADDCLDLILYHDVRFSGSRKQVKRVLQILGEEKTRLLFQVQRADIAAQSDFLRKEKLASVDLAEQTAEIILRDRQCLHIRDLAVNGTDLIEAGIPEGEQIGKALKALLDAVIDEKVENEREALMELAGRLYD